MTSISKSIIAVHTTCFCGCVTVIRTTAGLVLIDTAKPDTAGKTLAAELLSKPYLLPRYDDPQFVVRGIWHLYAGWFDGNPAHLKPAPSAELAGEIAALAGGAATLAGRAKALAEAGKIRLAAHLIELASSTSPTSAEIQTVRAKV